jgi:RNA polymerase sigma-70 factor, ECF subfamily
VLVADPHRRGGAGAYAVAFELKQPALAGHLLPTMGKSARSGDRAARFRAVFDRNYRALLGYALRRTDQAEDAADVVAETFLVAWRRLEDIPQGDAERPWLYGVAKRVLANHARGARRRDRLAERLRFELPAAVLEPFEAPPRGTLSDAFRALPDRDREILTLAAWERLDSAGAAAVVGCSPTAARIRLHRARRRLAAELAARGVEVKPPGPSGQSPNGVAESDLLREEAR